LYSLFYLLGYLQNSANTKDTQFLKVIIEF